MQQADARTAKWNAAIRARFVLHRNNYSIVHSSYNARPSLARTYAAFECKIASWGRQTKAVLASSMDGRMDSCLTPYSLAAAKEVL